MSDNWPVQYGSTEPLANLAACALADLVIQEKLPDVEQPMSSTHSNKIIEILRERKALTLKSLKYMNNKRFTLTKIDLSGVRISQTAVLLCSKHVLTSFRLGECDFKETEAIDVGYLLKAASHPHTRHTLRHLDVSGKCYMNPNFPAALFNYPNLESLSLANRNATVTMLKQICFNLPGLRHLDISGTQISDISSIRVLKNLEVLSMHNLSILTGKVGETIEKLHKLRVLDVSNKVNSDQLLETSQEASVDLAEAIFNTSLSCVENGEPTPWPELRMLDLSGHSLGQRGTDSAIRFVETIVTAHPLLAEVGVLATPLDVHSFTIKQRPSLSVINASSRQSSLYALHHYTRLERPSFTAHALHHVYYFLQTGYDQFTPVELSECLASVCAAMKKCTNTLAVQIAGSACLYHICKQKRIKRLSRREVNLVIGRCLEAALAFRNMIQLQKNVWLTVCNDYLLQRSEIDFSHTVKVALETMLHNRDASVQRMTIAIVSIVAPKMRSTGPRMIADSRHVQHLLQIMSDFIEGYPDLPNFDHAMYTLKFTLSALWNLTDECEETCGAFLEGGGIKIAFKILDALKDHVNVQIKVLGILNNVAEIHNDMMFDLCNRFYIQTLVDCLRGDFSSCDSKGRHRLVERAYFAAGVLSNVLAIDYTDFYDGIGRTSLEEVLLETVVNWPSLPCAMVTYRSFEPFVKVMSESYSNGAILWCLWGIHHVLYHRKTSTPYNTKLGYIELLREGKCYEICRKIAERDPAALSVHPSVIGLANEIMDIINSEAACMTDVGQPMETDNIPIDTMMC